MSAKIEKNSFSCVTHDHNRLKKALCLSNPVDACKTPELYLDVLNLRFAETHPLTVGD